MGREARAGALEELEEALGRLFAAERRLRGREQQRQEGELTLAHARALFALGRREESTAGQVAEMARMSPASITGLLDDLERAGIARRRRGESDRRRVLVSLTAEGRALLERRRGDWEARFGARLEGLGDEELAAAIEVIGRISELLDEV